MRDNLTVKITYPSETSNVISGGIDPAHKNWDEYLSEWKDQFKPHLNLIKKAIEENGLVGETAENYANTTAFQFSDGVELTFTWRAWGDLMSAIVGKGEGYMNYYM